MVSKSVVYKIMTKQKVFNIINPNFSKHINVFSYLYSCLQKQNILFLCSHIYSSSMEIS